MLDANLALRSKVPPERNMPSKLARMRVQLGLIGILLAVACGITAQPSPAGADWQLASPNGNVTVNIRLAESPYYSVGFRGRQVVTDSKLGLEFTGGTPAASMRWKFLKITQGGADTSWSNPFGKNNPVSDHYKQLELAFDVEGGQSGG
jgi:hypothetical protein